MVIQLTNDPQQKIPFSTKHASVARICTPHESSRQCPLEPTD